MSEQFPDKQPWRIVATDDDPKLLAKVTYALRDAGHIVFAAYNGFVAHQLATTAPEPDLLITNTRIHGMTAAELIRQVRAIRPGLPILHIGDPLPAEAGEIPTLREPVTSQALLEAVAALVEKSGAAPRDRQREAPESGDDGARKAGGGQQGTDLV